jgi:GcrA cell cycle regulator
MRDWCPYKGGNRPGSSWNDERVELLKRLWADGLHASVIAARLGGISRNAVIGKVHRIGLPGRVTNSMSKSHYARIGGLKRTRNAGQQRRAKKPKPHPAPSMGANKRYIVKDQRPDHSPPPDPIVPENERRGVADVHENQCRYPYGDPGEPDFHFCNRKKKQGLSWCELHAQKVFVTPEVRSRRGGFSTPANTARTQVRLVSNDRELV